MEMLLFGEPTNMEDSINISELRQLLESLIMPQAKAQLVARYLVEEPDQGDFIYNENLTVNIGAALDSLQKLIGEYSLYFSKDEELHDDNSAV